MAKTEEEILEYCYQYLISKPKDFKKFKKTKLYKDMIKEISFMINTT
jgi:hypothetical protein